MRTGTILVMAAAFAGAAAMASCRKHGGETDGRQAVRFSAAIDGQTVAGAPGSGTRAAGTEWGNGDAIGVFMVGHGGTTIAEGAENRQYTTTGNGSFVPAATADAIYYPMEGPAVDFIACYPYEGGATLGAPVAVTIGSQTAQSSFDLLWAKADNAGAGYTKTTAGAVALGFGHKLAKLVLNTTADPSVGASLAGMTVKINGMNTVNTFDLATGALGTADTPAAIVPRTVTDGSVYDAIIMPGGYAAGTVTVEFTVGGDTYTWDAGEVTFDGGNEYSYDVTLTRTGVSVTGAIKPWITIDRGGVTAE